MKYLWLSLILGFYSSCSSTYKIPMARMMSAESEGTSKASLQGGIHEFHEVTLTQFISQTPVSSSTHSVNAVASYGMSGNYGVLEHLDLGLDVEWAVAPMLFGKYQILGESKRKAQSGNFSASLLAGLGQDSSSSQSDVTLFGSNPGKIDRDSSAILEAGFLVGYRVSSHAVFALGSSMFWQTVQGNQILSSSSTPLPFLDHARYTEFHGSGTFTTSENSVDSFFITPSLQWGYTQSFGNRTYLVAAQLDLGMQF